MEFINTFVLPVFYAFFASMGFAILFQLRGAEMVYTSVGGGLSWAVYLFVAHCFPAETDVTAYLFASLSIALFSEIMAILRRRPALLYITIAIFPIVPGAAILRTMEYLVQNEVENFIVQGIYSVQVSGAIAIGILIGSSAVRLLRKAVSINKRQKGLT